MVDVFVCTSVGDESFRPSSSLITAIVFVCTSVGDESGKKWRKQRRNSWCLFVRPWEMRASCHEFQIAAL